MISSIELDNEPLFAHHYTKIEGKGQISGKRRRSLLLGILSVSIILWIFFLKPSLFEVKSSCIAIDHSMNDWDCMSKTLHSKVAILESAGYHDEVTLAFSAALAKSDNIYAKAYLKSTRYGSEEMYKRISKISKGKFSLVNLETFTSEQFESVKQEDLPDVVISTTCHIDLGNKKQAFETLLKRNKTVLWCIIHHASLWDDEKVGHVQFALPWFRQNRLKLISLSRHVTRHMLDHSFFKNGDVETMVPVFDLPVNSLKGENEQKSSDKETKYIAIQGNLDPGRRDYSRAIKEFEKAFLLDAGIENDYRLVLIGDGEGPKIPTNLTGKIIIQRHLSYPDYYNFLHRSSVILPAFAHDGYLKDSASSTVPASIIAGVPMVADREMLDAYSCLSDQTIISKIQGESEMEAAKRFALLPKLAQSRIAANLRSLQRSIIDYNVQQVRSWIYESKERQRGITLLN